MRLTHDQIVEYRNFAEELAEAAGSAIMPYFRTGLHIQDKGGGQFNPVTAADLAAERIMREMIRNRYPDHGIVGEEEGAIAGANKLKWILDPVDGTQAFIAGLPLWGTLIALNDGMRPVMGVMNQPFTKERFVGTPDGAWSNARQLRTRRCGSLGSARLMCTSPLVFNTDDQRRAFDMLAAEAQMVRFGGDCYAYCMLASGYIDTVIEAGLEPYDMQALIPIIEGAGGVITAWDGGDPQDGGAIVACGDHCLHAKIIERLRAHIPS